MIDVARVVQIVRHRDLSCEGIPMLLALNGARPAPIDDPRAVAGRRLADALVQVHEALVREARPRAAEPSATEVPGIVEGADSDEALLEAEARRAVSEEEEILAEAISVLAYAELEVAGDGQQRAVGARGASLRPAAPAGLATAGEDEAPARGESGGGLLARTVQALREGRFVTVINYHNTPAASAPGIHAELQAWGRRYAPVTQGELRRLFDAGSWEGSRLPLLPVFYEGYRNNYEHGAPACEAAGLVGWFFLITQFLDTPPAEQVQYARAHHIGLADAELERDRVAMSWQEAGELAGRHVVTSHTANHRASHTVLADADMQRELIAPAQAIRRLTGAPPVAHAWLFGSGLGDRPAQARRLHELGYRWVFGNIAVDAVPTPTA